jgi:hypothetical protein
MKKLIAVVLLALSLTTIKISAAQERIYYDFTYGDGVYYDLDTGIAKTNERFAVTNRNRVRSDKIWIVGNNYHHILWWGENNRYLGYHNSANASYQNDKYLGDVTLFVTPPEGARYFHLQVCKERDNLIDFIEYPPQGALEVIDKNSFSFTDYAGPVNHEVIYEDLDDGYAPRMVLEYGHTYYIRYSLVKLAELLAPSTALFYGGYSPSTIIKADLDDLSTLDTSVSYGGTIYSIAIDDTYIYAGGYTTQTVRKYSKNDLSYVGETPSYGGNINSIAIDDTHIYVGGVTTKVRKYLKSNLSYIGETPSYGDYIWAIAIDDTHIYVGGDEYRVKKYLKSNLSYIGETPSYGGTIESIAIDDTHIYVGGVTTKVRKYLKSNLSYIGQTASYGGAIYSIAIG